MSVKPVKAVSIIGMMSELDKVIKFCGDSQMFHPDDAMSFYSDTRNFVPLNDKNPYSTPLQELRNTADMLGFELNYVKLKNFSVSMETAMDGLNIIPEERPIYAAYVKAALEGQPA